MNCHIPHLDAVLLVIASLYPVGLGANFVGVMKGLRSGQRPSIAGDLFGFVLGYALVLTVVGLARPHQVFAFALPAWPPLLVLAPLGGIACIVLEYVAGILIFFVRTGRWVTKVAVHGSYSDASRIAVTDVLSILGLVIGEELVVRQLLYNLLATDFALSLWIVIGSCTVVYALNHLAFGITSVISKLGSGLLYVLLYYFSGWSIAAVIVAHATQNLGLLALSRRRD
jgi:membrane protease YdiL (CAAX protease family)